MISIKKPGFDSPVVRQYKWADDNSPATRLSRFLLIGSANQPTKLDRFIYGVMDWGTVCNRVTVFLTAVDSAGIGEQLNKVIDELP